MALAGVHAQAQVGVAATTLYTAPAAGTLFKVNVTLSNIDTVQHTVTVQTTDDSAATTRSIVTSAPVPVGGALHITGIILDLNDSLTALTDVANMIEATVDGVALT